MDDAPGETSIFTFGCSAVNSSASPSSTALASDSWPVHQVRVTSASGSSVVAPFGEPQAASAPIVRAAAAPIANLRREVRYLLCWIITCSCLEYAVLQWGDVQSISRG